jgi:hypothetical protein
MLNSTVVGPLRSDTGNTVKLLIHNLKGFFLLIGGSLQFLTGTGIEAYLPAALL